jgi:predicted nucleotide-binding protein (sugar kinase/HSP70/actin superfamily)
MNEGCSAGTGSFLEESVSADMGIPVNAISSIAESSEKPIAFGERCAAFINTDLRNASQQGALRNDIVAGLVYSIAKNYLSRIVGVRPIGKNLLFQGGVALNRAVALAMAAVTKRKVVVPPHPELLGCIGTCLMALDLVRDGDETEKNIDLGSLLAGSVKTVGTFKCQACGNKCEVRRIQVAEKTFPFGGLCSKYEMARHGKEAVQRGKNLIELRNDLMFEQYGPKPINGARGTVGIPSALTTYEFYPFFAKLFEAMGYDTVLSRPSPIGNTKTRGPICYPCEIAHGAVYDLLERGVDYLFIPYLVAGDIPHGIPYSYICSSTANITDLIKEAFPNISEKLLAPYLGFSRELRYASLRDIGKMGQTMGVRRSKAEYAGKIAFRHYEEFKKRYMEIGSCEFESLRNEPSVIIAGKPYVTYASEVNIALPQKIASRGYNVLPADMLPPSGEPHDPGNVWLFTQQVMNAIAHVKQYPNLSIALISCFSCITDASMYHLIRDALAGQTFCYLLIDSHTAHAGFDTRVGAFLDIIGERDRKRRKTSN